MFSYSFFGKFDSSARQETTYDAGQPMPDSDW